MAKGSIYTSGGPASGGGVRPGTNTGVTPPREPSFEEQLPFLIENYPPTEWIKIKDMPPRLAQYYLFETDIELRGHRGVPKTMAEYNGWRILHKYFLAGHLKSFSDYAKYYAKRAGLRASEASTRELAEHTITSLYEWGMVEFYWTHAQQDIDAVLDQIRKEQNLPDSWGPGQKQKWEEATEEQQVTIRYLADIHRMRRIEKARRSWTDDFVDWLDSWTKPIASATNWALERAGALAQAGGECLKDAVEGDPEKCVDKALNLFPDWVLYAAVAVGLLWAYDKVK